MVKKETIYETVSRLADKEIPDLIERVLLGEDMGTTDKINLSGLLDTALHHLRLVKGRLKQK